MSRPQSAAIVDVPAQIAAWLVSFGAIKDGPTVLNSHNHQIRQLRPSEWVDIQNGKQVGTILAKVFVAHGQPNPVPPMRDGDEAAVRLHNWNALVPHLHTFGIDFAPDVKALVVAGDHAALIKQLHELRVRCGLGTGAGEDPWSSSNRQGSSAPANLPGNTDRQELVSSTLFQVIGLYSIMVASLLTVFIQQDCGTTVCVGSGASRVCTTENYACSFSDNLGVTSKFGKLVVAFNFVTLAVFLVSNVVFFFRERWIIQHFDTDNDLPIDNLTFEIKLYPRFRAVLGRYNAAAVWLASTLVLLLTTNLVLSAIQILRFRYAGKASVIGLLSNTGLVTFKVLNWHSVARRSRAEDSAISLFDLRNRGMNTVSRERKFAAGEYVPDIAAA